jgi:hypothetical protein
MKKINKTETMQEFLARGGKVTVCSTFVPKKKRSYTKRDEEKSDDTINEDLIPEALRITLGLR